MKKTTKISVAMALATCLASASASADMVLGLFAGVQGWDMNADGSFGTSNNNTAQAEFSFDSESQGSIYVALEHPVPLVPNIKIKHNQMDTIGNTQLNSTFSFAGTTYSVNSSLDTNIDLTNTDFIMYYEILDNDLVTLDVGLNVKKIDGRLDVVDINDASLTAREEFDGVVPMLYGAIKVGLPFTGLGVFADGSLLSVGDHTLYDYEAGIGYTFVDNVAIDLTLQLGYRAVKLELEDLDDIDSNLEFDGVFVGLEAHF
ncbi:MAG: outer membrane protein [Phenylobacterium sp.]|jgi:outer membrane protein